MNTKSRWFFRFVVLANLALYACMAAVAGAATVVIPLVTVGDPGNVPDPLTGYGAVPYVYQIGTYDVTVGQYCQFLNAVAATDPYGLYNRAMAPSLAGFQTFGILQSGNLGNYSYSFSGSYSQGVNCPIYDVSWGDAARFVNWLQNGQPKGAEGPRTTETGTYNLNGGTSDAALMAVSRSTTANWVLPTVDEWYKAAFYSGGGTNSSYWLYATQSDDTPSNLLSATGTNNANFNNGDINPPDYGWTDIANGLTPVGAFADSPSAFGTFDQDGDVYQWNETSYDDGTARGFAGGGYAGGPDALMSEITEGVANPSAADNEIGFRVAYVPEPPTFWLLLSAAMGCLIMKRLSRIAKGANHA